MLAKQFRRFITFLFFSFFCTSVHAESTGMVTQLINGSGGNAKKFSPDLIVMLIDVVLLLLLIYFVLKGLHRGLLAQFISTASLLLMIPFGKIIFDSVFAMLKRVSPGADRNVVLILSGVLMLCFVFCFTYVFEKILKYLLNRTLLGYMDDLLGGALGLVQGAFCISLLILILGQFDMKLPVEYAEKTYLYESIKDLAPNFIGVADNYLPEGVVKWIREGIKLLEKGGKVVKAA